MPIVRFSWERWKTIVSILSLLLQLSMHAFLCKMDGFWVCIIFYINDILLPILFCFLFFFFLLSIHFLRSIHVAACSCTLLSLRCQSMVSTHFKLFIHSFIMNLQISSHSPLQIILQRIPSYAVPNGPSEKFLHINLEAELLGHRYV